MRVACRSALGVSVVAVALLSSVAAQVQEPPATLRLTGRVVDHATGRPVSGAAVTIAGGPALPDPPTLIADENGRFAFVGLRAARFTLTATAQGYLTGGEHSEDGMPPAEVTVDLTKGESKTDVELRLVKPASLSGSVLDEANGPVEGVSLAALREVYVAGYRRLASAGAAGPDDRGAFRFDRLAPGQYVVCAITERTTVPRSWQDRLDGAATSSPAERMALENLARRALFISGSNNAFVLGDFLLRHGSIGMGPFATSDGRVWSAPNACNGGTDSPLAAPVIQVTSGRDVVGADLRVDLQPAARISGRVNGPGGSLPWQGLRLDPEGFDALGWADGMGTASTMSDASGSFTFLGIPQGTYTLRAFNVPQPIPGAPTSQLPEGDTFAAQQALSVGKDGVDDVVVQLVRGPRLSGRLTFSGSSTPPSEAEVGKAALSIQFADGKAMRFPFMRPRAVVLPDGTFRSMGVIAGRHLIDVAPIGPWQLESAMLNGVDVSDVPLDATGDDIADIAITMTDRVPVVSGTVRDDKGLVVDGGRVVVFPTDRTRWVGQGERPRRQQMTETSASGSYSLRGLPAGEYFVVALGAKDRSVWQTPNAFARFAVNAQKITLAARETRTLDLRAEGR